MVSVERTFSIDDQAAFARLSGDFNPLHVDAVAARRSLTGGAVVHGMHLLMWALDAWSRQRTDAVTLISLDTAFLKPVTVGALVRLSEESRAGSANIRIHVGDLLATTIDIRWRDNTKAGHTMTGIPERETPVEMDGVAIASAQGNLPLLLDLPLASSLVPALVRCLPASQIAFMLASTRLVGVKCPGLHSLYSELHFSESEDEGGEGLFYRVKQFDPRFSLALMHITSPGIIGSIKAFLRPKPQRQPSCDEVRATLRSGLPFAAQRALVVGGSRGIGEVFAKALAMGGAEVMLTYHLGRDEALAIVADIQAGGGKAACMQLDVTDGQVGSVADFAPTHLYYMATPFIGSGQHGQFNALAFSLFCSYYVEGFANLLAAAKGPALQAVYYPSSIFLNEMPANMCEYIAAKSAGEALGTIMMKAQPALRIACPRLPRLLTDQTSSLLPSSHIAILPLVLDQLQQFSMKKS